MRFHVASFPAAVLTIAVLVGALSAQGVPKTALPAELRIACDTIAALLRSLPSETVKQSVGSVQNPVTHGPVPWCRVEARGDMRALPAGTQPGTALVRNLGWRQDAWEASAADFATSAGVVRDTVFCIIGAMWNGDQGGRARGQPAHAYYVNVDCRIDTRRALAAARQPAPGDTGRVSVIMKRVRPGTPAPSSSPRAARDTTPTPAPADSVTKRPVRTPHLPSKERVLGPFTWRDSQVYCVLTETWLGRDTTVSALRVIDAHNAVLYQESYGAVAGATGLDAQLGVRPALLEARDGTALMLQEYSEPSAPMGGVSRKLLAWKDGQIRPLSPALTVYGEFVDLPKGDTPNTVRLLPGNLMPIRVWAYSFWVLVSLEIRLTAFAAGDAEPLRPNVQIDTLSGLAIFPISDPVLSSAQYREQVQQVMLYRSASGSAGEAVQVRRTSEIQYGPAYGRVRLDRDRRGLSVSVEVGIVRLRVTIDGRTGFVEQSDFAAVGLSVAG